MEIIMEYTIKLRRRLQIHFQDSSFPPTLCDATCYPASTHNSRSRTLLHHHRRLLLFLSHSYLPLWLSYLPGSSHVDPIKSELSDTRKTGGIWRICVCCLQKPGCSLARALREHSHGNKGSNPSFFPRGVRGELQIKLKPDIEAEGMRTRNSSHQHIGKLDTIIRKLC